MAVPEILLTEEQRLEFTNVPEDISDFEIARHYTLTDKDIGIISLHRRDYNRLGFAVQLCMLRNPGWPLGSHNEIPDMVLSYIAEQLHVNPEIFSKYFQRRMTKYEHLEELQTTYGYRQYSEEDGEMLSIHLLPFAMENDNIIHLIRESINKLKRNLVILPGITTIERIVNEVRIMADEQVIKSINDALTPLQKQKMDKLIESPDEAAKTVLGWLKEDPGKSSPKAFLEVVERLEKIRELDLNIDIAGIHPNRLRQLTRLGSKYEPRSFRRFDADKRHAILGVYLHGLSQSLVDLAVEIHDRQINTLFSKGRKEQDEIQKQNGKSLNEKIIQFADLGAALIKARNEGLDPYDTIESVMPWEMIVESVEEARKLVRPLNYDYLDLLDVWYNHLRKYTPVLVKCLEFSSTNTSMKPLLDALKLIKEMNETGARKMPPNAPMGFITNRWDKFIFEPGGQINRHYYEMAVLTELRNRTRAGDIAVKGSRNYRNFDEYLVSKEGWIKAKETSNTQLAVSTDYNYYLRERSESLNNRLERLSRNLGSLEGVNIDTDGIHVEKLDKDTPEEAEVLSQRLYGMLPHIKLPELLQEVAGWTNFDRKFIHASTGNLARNEEIPVLMATLMAMGTNIGLYKMAESTPGISYWQMANMAQWRMYDEAMIKAQAVLVNYQHKQALSAYWGDGTTSSSDGMRVQVGVSALNAEHNPHYGSQKGTTMYRFISDQYSSYYSTVIPTNSRDALYVIDGAFFHETDLNICEHYTDTAGYTDQVFGLCHLLGLRFAPRIRGISELVLYSLEDPVNYRNIQHIIKGKINLKLIRENYDDVLRLAHSIRTGKVTGSSIMSKLGSYSRQNTLAAALREMGRIEKTIFILDFITDKRFRRRIQKGLNKGEAVNALAREGIFIGKHGVFRERELQDQLQRASALSIIINAISVWNTKYLQKAANHLKANGTLMEDLLQNISPLGWEHINFLGDYNFNVQKETEADDLRPLNFGNIV